MEISDIGVSAVRQKNILNVSIPNLEKWCFAFIVTQVGVCAMSEKHFGHLCIVRTMEGRFPLVILRIIIDSLKAAIGDT